MNDTAELQVEDRSKSTTEKLHDAAARVRESAAEGYSAAKQKTGESMTSLRENSQRMLEEIKEKSGTLAESPAAILIGAISLGALIGSLLPRGQRERQLLDGVNGKLAGAMHSAISAARETGQEALGELGITREAAGTKVDELFDGLIKVISSAGTAASSSVRQQGGPSTSN